MWDVFTFVCRCVSVLTTIVVISSQFFTFVVFTGSGFLTKFFYTR